jgi:hypothetical protein
VNEVVPFRGQPSAPPSFAMSDMERIAMAFAASNLFGVKNPDQALALCLVAQAEGRHPATAAQDYSIISGRPSKKADAMLRDFIASGGKVQWHELSNEKAEATFTHPAGGSVRIDWTMARAKQAGLGTNAMYAKYPRQMLRARTVSEGVRTVCPGATSGMYVPEEVQDFEPQAAALPAPSDDIDFTGTPQPPLPKAKARDVYDRLCKGLREAAQGTEADLTAWFTANADDVGSLPHDWRGRLREEYGDALRACRERAADPHGLKVDVPSGEGADWLGYVEEVVLMIQGAITSEQVEQAQIVNGVGLSAAAMEIEGVAERVAEAVEQRLAQLSERSVA